MSETVAATFDPYSTSIDFDPLSPDLARDPYPHYARLRASAPVWKSPLGHWLLTRYDDVTRFFSDQGLHREFEASAVVRMGPSVGENEYFHLFRRMLNVLDNPEHRRVRSLLSRAFTARRVIAERAFIEQLTHELIDEVATTRTIDLVGDYGSKLPKMVIGHMLGLPREDWITIGEWTDGLIPAFEFFPMTGQVLADVNATCRQLYDYVSELADQRARDPKDDLMTAMVQATTEGEEKFTREELISNTVLLFLGGQETTAGAINLSILNLHRNPDQLRFLVEDPQSIPGSIDELLRFDNPATTNVRMTQQETVFSGVAIPAGEAVIGYLSAGLRDPDAFEDPDRLDLRRDLTGKKTSFGGGPFLCIGHALARAEMEIALDTLFQRCPGLTLETLDPEYKPSSILRGPAVLNASW